MWGDMGDDGWVDGRGGSCFDGDSIGNIRRRWCGGLAKGMGLVGGVGGGRELAILLGDLPVVICFRASLV